MVIFNLSQFAGDFPVAIGSHRALCFPKVSRDGRVRIMRLTDSGKRNTFTLLPVATEIGPDGESVKAKWILGLAAGPDRSPYYTEQRRVRRVASDGTVTAVAERIQVPGCIRPPAAVDERLGPALRDLEVQQDGTVYGATSADSSLLGITKDAEASIVMHGSDAWSPTGVAIFDGDILVPEHRYVETTRREDWLSRVRKISRHGTVTVLATISQR